MATSRRLPTSYNESTYDSHGTVPTTCDYTSLATWESDTDNNLTTAEDGEVLTCAAGIHDDSVTLAGAITNSSYFRVIRGAVGTASPTGGARFVKSFGATGFVFYVDGNAGAGRDDYAGIYDVGIKATASSANVSVHGFFTRDSTGVKIVGCSVYDCASSGTGYTNGILFVRCSGGIAVNNFVTNCTGGSGAGSNSALRFSNTSTGTDTYYAYNNTLTDSTIGLRIEKGSTGPITVLSTNNIIQSNTTDISVTGTTPTHTQTTNAVDESLVFEDDDFHLDPDNQTNLDEAIEQGTDLSSDGNFAFDDDIDGTTRPLGDDWDIGCDEVLLAETSTDNLDCKLVITRDLTINEDTDYLRDRRVIAYDENETGSLVLSGAYTNTTPTHIEARVFNRTTTATVQINSSDWTQLTSETISGGTWSGTLSGIPKTNAWLGFEVRKSNETGTTCTSENKIGVGYVVILFGQSYIDQWLDFDDATYTPTAHDLTSKFRHANTGQFDDDFPDYTGWTLNTGAGAGVFANKLREELECPIGLLDYGMGGSALLEENKGVYGYWVGSSAADNWYEDLQDGLDVSEPASRRKVNAALWYQGYTDVYGSISYQDYYDGMEDLFGYLETDTNWSDVPIFVAAQPRDEGILQGYSVYASNIRQAQVDICDDDGENTRIFAGQSVDLDLMVDGIHLTAESQSIEALRYAQSVLWHEIGTGDFTYHRGPRNTGWTIIDSTTIDVTIVHDGGTDFTPTSDIDSYEVKIGSTWYSATGARQSATVVRLTHTEGTVTELRCLWGMNPDIAYCVKDNSALNLPVEAVQSFSAINVTNLLDLKVEVIEPDINLLDGKIRIKDTIINLLDGKIIIGETATNLLDGKIIIGETATKLLDAKVKIKDFDVDVVDGKIVIQDIDTQNFDLKVVIRDGGADLLDLKTIIADIDSDLLDGKITIKDVATQLLDGKLQIKDYTINLLDGKVKIKDYATDLLDGKVKLKDVATDLLDGRIQIETAGSPTDLLDCKVIIKDYITTVLDGKIIVKDSATNLLDGKLVIGELATDNLDGKITIKDSEISLVDGKVVVKDIGTNLLDLKVKIEELDIDILDGKIVVKDAEVILLDGKIVVNDGETAELNSNKQLLIDSIGGKVIALGNNRMPTWNTAGRPASPKTGEFGYNTQSSQLEVYDGSNWQVI